jgi:dimethylaniline monooxygenase (N-oxide forming)
VQVYLSTRRGAWIVGRIGEKGVPIDALRQRRIVNWFMRLLPWSVKNSLLENASNQRFDHTMYGLKPAHRYLSQHPSINDALPNRLSSGTLVMKPNIKLITDSSVQFDDGSTVDDIDAIILATGYTFGFPFLEKEVVNVQNNVVELYKYIFPPHLQPHTLAIIGCVQPVGSLNPISEMQSRLATRVFKVTAVR